MGDRSRPDNIANLRFNLRLFLPDYSRDAPADPITTPRTSRAIGLWTLLFKGRELNLCKNNEGNPIVLLRGLTKRCIVVNQLVAQTFLPPITGTTIVRHIDGDRSNNHVSNLEWVIRKVRLPKGRGRKLDL